jgi:hypothetical protein
LALLLGAASPAAPAEDRALLIGIGRYQLPQLRLQGPPNDLQAVRRMLLGSFGFRENQIKELKDDQATEQGIFDALDGWLVEGTKGRPRRAVLQRPRHADSRQVRRRGGRPGRSLDRL